MVKTYPTLDAMKDELEFHDVLCAIPGLDSLDPAALRRFLTDDTDESYGSQWWKMVCLYDWLAYGRSPKARQAARRRVTVRRARKPRAERQKTS